MIKVIYKDGHYDVYRNGKFQCSADTRHEAEQDREEAEAEKENGGVKSPFHENEKMEDVKMIIGTWWSDSNIELVKIDGKIYALDGWNGEKYLHCGECIDRFTAADDNIEYEIRPIYDSSDEIIDFEVI